MGAYFFPPAPGVVRIYFVWEVRPYWAAFGLSHTNCMGFSAIRFVWPNICIFPKVDRGTRFRFDTLAHAKRWRHSCTNPNTYIYIVLNVLNVILLENSRIRFPSAARSGRLTGACVDIEERVQGVHVRISAQLGLDRFRMCAMTANPSNNCVNLYGLTQEI
jgi:hypothetical protein